jgi:hypothetical protein
VLCNGQDSLVEDLVFCGEVFAFPWQDAMWIPMFQFDMSGLAVESGPQSVASTLGLGFNGWAIASWFVEPCSWLGDHRPIECLGSRLSEVLYAARANRDLTLANSNPTQLDTDRYQ